MPRRKKQVLNTLEYDETKNEFTCNSLTQPDKQHTIIYSSKAQDWFCDCKAPLYTPYKTFEDLDKRNKNYIKYGCVHVIAARIKLALIKKI